MLASSTAPRKLATTKNATVLLLWRKPKEMFSLGTHQWDSYFGLWVAGPQYFPWCVGWVPLSLQKPSGSLFSQNLTHFSRFMPIFTHIFPVFVLCTQILTVFMLRASLLTPNFCSFYLSGCLWYPSEVAVLNG